MKRKTISDNDVSAMEKRFHSLREDIPDRQKRFKLIAEEYGIAELTVIKKLRDRVDRRLHLKPAWKALDQHLRANEKLKRPRSEAEIINKHLSKWAGLG